MTGIASLGESSEELNKACIRGDLEEVKRLVEMGADINERDAMGMAPILYAAREEHVEVLQWLMRCLAERAKENSVSDFVAMNGGDLDAAPKEGQTIEEIPIDKWACFVTRVLSPHTGRHAND